MSYDNRILYDEPPSVYFQRELDVASNSGLKIIGEQSPAHYHWWCTHPEDDESTAALDFGHAFHMATLEPAKFAATYCVLPSDAPARPTQAMINAKKPSPESLARVDWWFRWTSDHAGMQCLSDKDMQQITGMATAMRNHVLQIPDSDGKLIRIQGGELFDLCQREVTLRWTDPRTGIRCKARTDLHCNELAFGGDLKSAIDASPDGFARAVHRYRYHQQHVHYTDGAQATGTAWTNFLFFACEKVKPYVPAVYYVPAIAEERGRFLRDKALDRLKRSLDTGTWPGYTDTITELVLPAFAYYDADDANA
jgi:hypothetical protein